MRFPPPKRPSELAPENDAVMREALLAIGLLFALEGILLAGMTDNVKRRMAELARADSAMLRNIGLGAAAFGVALVWAARMLA